MAEGSKTYSVPEGLQHPPGAPGTPGSGVAPSAPSAGDDIPMMSLSLVPWWKPVLVVAGSLVLGWAGWRLWTTGDPRALLPGGAAQLRPFEAEPFGTGFGAESFGAGQRELPAPVYGGDCGCGG